MANHYLSCLQLYETTDIHSQAVLAYKVRNFPFTAKEVVQYFSDCYQAVNGSSIYGKTGKKLFFSKKQADHLLHYISAIYGELTTYNKSYLFLRLDEGILLQWLQTLDPVLLQVAEQMNQSLSDNVTLLLEHMQYVGSRSSSRLTYGTEASD